MDGCGGGINSGGGLVVGIKEMVWVKGGWSFKEHNDIFSHKNLQFSHQICINMLISPNSKLIKGNFEILYNYWPFWPLFVL